MNETVQGNESPAGSDNPTGRPRKEARELYHDRLAAYYASERDPESYDFAANPHDA